MKECTDKEWKYCEEEKIGCEGCFYNKEEEKKEKCLMKECGAMQ